jgi:hypothetical protein
MLRLGLHFTEGLSKRIAKIHLWLVPTNHRVPKMHDCVILQPGRRLRRIVQNLGVIGSYWQLLTVIDNKELVCTKEVLKIVR